MASLNSWQERSPAEALQTSQNERSRRAEVLCVGSGFMECKNAILGVNGPLETAS